MANTRGHKSSERRACYHAFYAGLALAAYGIYKGVDLVGLAALIGAVSTPLMCYSGVRSWVKRKHGETE